MKKRKCLGILALVLVTMLGAGMGTLQMDKSRKMERVNAQGEIPISTIDELANIKNDPSGSYYLTQDIDMSGYGCWEPFEFKGTLDGKGHRIQNMMVVNSDAGLFSHIKGATVQNLSLEQVYIKGSSYVGGIVGWAEGDNTIRNCYVSGTLEGSYYSGGIIGRYSGVSCAGTMLIENCYSACDANAGILYNMSYSGKLQIENCVSTGNCKVAGILGESYYNSPNVVIKNCYSTGIIGDGGAGVVYSAGSQTFLYNCYYLSDLAAGINTGIKGVQNASNTQGQSASGLSISAMQNTASFVGWSFPNVWTIESGVNEERPILTSLKNCFKTSKANASVASGTYQNSISVTLNAASGAAIYYTIDGSEPTIASTRYTGPIAISKDTTLRVIAKKDGFEASEEQKYEYKITVENKANEENNNKNEQKQQNQQNQQKQQNQQNQTPTIHSSRMIVGVGECVNIPSVSGSVVRATSTNERVAVCVNDLYIQGESKGTAIINIENNGNDIYKVYVTVKKAPKKVSFKKKKKTLLLGKSYKLAVSFSKGSYSHTLKYSSKNKMVAKVTKNGVVRTFGRGKTVITVKTYNGIKAKCVIKVK